MSANHIEAADWVARCYVQGFTRNERTGNQEPRSGHWSARFFVHPLVRQAETEGWPIELRLHVVRAVRVRILQGIEPKEMVIDELMPDAKWIAATRDFAKRCRKAAEWRAEIIEKWGTMDAYLTATNKGRGRSRRGGAASISSVVNSVVGEIESEEAL